MSEGTVELEAGAGRHYVSGAVLMLVASPLVLGSVVLMNELSQPPERHEVERGTVIEVAKAPPPKPKQEVKKPKPKPKQAPKAPPPPSLAALTSGLSGIAVDLPAFQFEDIGASAGDLLASGEEVVHTAQTVDDPPQPVQQEPIRYPPKLRDRGIEGHVELSVLIDEGGNVQRVKVLSSKPPGVFDDVAKEAMKSWRFSPAMYQGAPVKVWVTQRFTFDLRK